MKILYAEKPDAEGRHYIYRCVWDRDIFAFTHSINVPLSEMSIDEVEANKALCLDLVKTLGKEDAAKDRKYYIDADGDIIEKEGWAEYHDDTDAD